MAIFLIINIFILILLSLVFSHLSILGVGLIGFILLLIVVKSSKRKCFTHLTLIFIISSIFMLVTYYGYNVKYGVPYYIGGSDDLQFEQFAEYIVSQNYYLPYEFIQDSKFTGYNANGFIWILSGIMRFSNLLGGYHTIAYRILNIYFLLILSVLIFHFFTKKYNFSKQQNLTVLYAMSLFPNCLYISSHVFRDTLNVLLLFIIFYIWDRSLKYFKKVNYIFITLASTVILGYLLYLLRGPNLIFIASIILICVFLKENQLSLKNSMIFIVLVIIGITFMSTFDVYKEVLSTSESYSNYILSQNNGIASTIFSIGLLPLGIPLRIFYGLISPLPVSVMQFPNMLTDIDVFFNVIVALGVIVQIYMLPYLFYNIKKIDKITVLFSVFLVTIVITTFTFRHFIMIYPFMIIMMFRKFFEVSTTRKILTFIYMTGLLLIAMLAYLMIK